MDDETQFAAASQWQHQEFFDQVTGDARLVDLVHISHKIEIEEVNTELLSKRLGDVFFLAGIGLDKNFTKSHATRAGGDECLVNLSEGNDTETNENLAKFLTGLACQRDLLTRRTPAASHPAQGRATRTPYLRTGRVPELHLTAHIPGPDGPERRVAP
jgi:hypothetical protein